MTEAWHLGDPPPERRLLGLDRQLILPTLAVVAIILVMKYVIPAIDRGIPAIELDPTKPQAVHNQVEFTPGQGWITEGVPAPSAPELRIFREGVAVTIAPGAWNSDAGALLDMILHHYREYPAEGDRQPITLPNGFEGFSMKIFGAETDGALYALVAPGAQVNSLDERHIGVRVIVEGPTEELPALMGDIAAMLDSLRPLTDSEGAPVK